ncbi:MAG TPA: hypothetical protein VM074_08855 [Solimonas sp.]|nr:hypothetical protein [Solimonas sp.]
MSAHGSTQVRALRRLLAAVALLAAPQAAQAVSNCTCGTVDGKFTLTTITVDGASDAGGSLTGWGGPKGDLDNNTCDAASTGSPTELGGADGIADAPQNIGRDVTWFATTWDNNNVYFFTERGGSSNNIQRFIYYADTNTDGRMNQGEYVIEAEWSGSNRNVTVRKHTYNAVNAGGDLLVDTAGFADGYTMPGTVTLGPTLRGGTWGSTGGLEFEFFLTWADLGATGPVGIRWHISASNGSINTSNPPSGVQDNLGGCGGGVGSSAQVGVDITPDRSVAGRHGTLQCAAHVVTNTGNGNDIANISNSALPVQASGVGFYFDADASGTLTAGDTLLTDSAGDGDLTVDTGTVAAGASKNILACYTIGDDGNTYSPNGSGTVTLSANSALKPLVVDTAIDTISVILVPDPIVIKSSSAFSDPLNGAANPKRIPGGFVTYSITVTNASGGTIDSGTVVLKDPVPANLDLYVGDIAGAGSGPVLQTNGSPACGLTYSFSSLASTLDDLAFSNDGGATFNYTPVPSGTGVDAGVTHVLINPKGVFAGRSAAGQPACTWSFRARVE